MNRLSRDSWLAIALGLMIIAVLVIAGSQQSSGLPPYTSLSSAPSGTRALRVWLEENGFSVSDEVNSGVFAIPNQASVVLILEPLQLIAEQEWEALDKWISAGGTLILAGQQFPTVIGFDYFNFDSDYLVSAAPQLTLQNPLLSKPPVTTPITANAEMYLFTTRSDYVVHLAAGDRPVLVSFGHGAGAVILSTTPYPFSNLGLKDPGSTELIRNLITHSADGMIWFDEWHHGITTGSQLVGPQDWLFGSWAGRAVLYIAVLTFVVLLLQGQRFGRPLSLAHERTRRAPLEYISAIANLSRRAGHRHFVLGQYHRRLKAVLGQRYRLHPSLSDEDFIHALEAYKPPIDLNQLRILLSRLRNQRVSEAEMVDLSAQVAMLLEERPAPRQSI
jgi:hypothetical protein